MRRKAPIKDARIDVLNQIWAQVIQFQLPAQVLERIWNSGCVSLGLVDPEDEVFSGSNLPLKAEDEKGKRDGSCTDSLRAH